METKHIISDKILLFEALKIMGNAAFSNGETYLNLPFWFKPMDNGFLEVIKPDELPKHIIELISKIK